MAGSAERYALRGDGGVGVVGVEGRDQAGDVDEAVGGGEMAGRVGERVVFEGMEESIMLSMRKAEASRRG